MSNLIKSNGYIALEETMLVDSLSSLLKKAQAESKAPVPDEEAAALWEKAQGVLEIKDQIIQDAEEFAESTITRAADEANQIKLEAQQEIETWWVERRSTDEAETGMARESGYQAGYQEGTLQAEQMVRNEYAQMINEARGVLEHSYQLKRQIIAEAEPFLIELSTAIAEKIIQHQLTVNPEWVVDLAGSVLGRRREKGTITLCVAPVHFSYFQEMREELRMSLDSQAELDIVPDSSVSDHGCIIRSVYGSIDARIDTQLKEIKAALLDLTAEEDREEDE
ncbi:FliH/SctL family protein [Gorillibacterium massiliense]|uniref:FliH/SctL family protein n=1 Tax=Gorillibacterium massiliense TaxID=1280390 RepID=UPI0004ADDA86|nr:FliH/SctL family protein [Gorillibacterium massiliense]